MAVKSPISLSTVNKSVGLLGKSLTSAQKSAGKVNSSILQRNRLKRETISKKNTLFIQRRSAVRRRESQDIADAATTLGVRRSPAKIGSISTKSFFGRMLDVSGALFAGWLVNNLPSIINLAEATTRRSIEVARVLGGAVNSFGNILSSFFGGLTTIGASILRGDIASIPTNVSKSILDIQSSFTNMMMQLEDAYKVLMEPLDFSKDLEELKERLGLEVPSGAPGGGTPGRGSQLEPIHRQALDIIAGPESGGDYNAMNNGQAGDRPGGSKKWLGKNLTDMTIGEVKNYQNVRKTLWAAGKYQIVPGTLPSAQAAAGLKDNDMFDQNNQDLLAIGILKTQGPGAWTNYSKYSKKEIDIMYKAKATPLKPYIPAQVNPNVTYAKNQDITSLVGVKGTPSVVITSLRGMRTIDGQTKFHKGIDIATDTGVYIALRANAVVLYAGDSGDGYGYKVDLWVESYGIRLRIGHCSSILANCKVGASIPAGVSFARVGSTGSSTGPHIHLEADTNKNKSGSNDPSPYVTLLLLTSRQSNGFIGATANGKPSAQINRPSGQGGPELLEALTPERRGQDVIVMSTPQQQQVQQSQPAQSKGSMVPMGEPLNNLYNKILLTQLAYT